MTFKKGYKPSEETRQKISLSHIGMKMPEEIKMKIGIKNKGKHHTEETKRKLSVINTSEKHPQWKGDNIGKGWTLHAWIRRYLPVPNGCEFCGQSKKLDAANITGDYNREFKNWKYLCKSCHAKYDNKIYNIKKMRILLPDG